MEDELTAEQKADDRFEKYTDIWKGMLAECNHGGQEEIIKSFAEAMCRDHRTLQQRMVGMMIDCLVAYAKETDTVWNGCTDARNDAAVAFCRALANSKPYLPFI
jgi:hypothetical protein